MKIVRISLIISHLFVGLGGVAGGLGAILNPQAPMGASVEMLQNSPFTDFIIPGLFLLVVIGLGNLTAAGMFLLKLKVQGYISGLAAGALVSWIVVQCIMIQAVVFLHVLFFCIGIVQGLLSLALLAEHRLFPTEILCMWCKKKP
jgi:hypothetical protein